MRTDPTQESGVSERFSGNGGPKFPKNCVKMKERDAKWGGKRQKPGKFEAAGKSSYLTGRVRISRLCSHPNSSSKGASESTKKSGPPRRWIML